jgi:hypothetical protein
VYLLPILPSLCILAATAVVSGVSLLRRYEIPRAPRTALIAGLTIAALMPPALKAIDFNRTIGRTSTAALAYDWVQKNVPKDAVIVLESRMLLLANYPHADNGVQLRHRQYEDYVADKVDYLIASSASYEHYFASPEKFPHEYAEYRRLFDQCQELVRFTPSSTHPGAELIIFKVRR